MKNERYNFTTQLNSTVFEFISKGKKGNISKLVQYTPMNIEGYFNLGFGDYDETTKEIDDEIITNNGDALKVLSTVVSTVYAFTAKYPESYIFATGSNEVRTRLYRMGISNNLEEIKTDFYVYGLRNDDMFEDFNAGEDYKAFLVTRKNKQIKI